MIIVGPWDEALEGNFLWEGPDVMNHVYYAENEILYASLSTFLGHVNAEGGKEDEPAGPFVSQFRRFQKMLTPKWYWVLLFCCLRLLVGY